MIHARPIPMSDTARPPGALPLAGGPLWFDRVEILARGGAPRLAPAADLPPDLREALTAPRPDWGGIVLDRPRIMGILNVTPDSFSDGGRYLGTGAAVQHAREMAAAGADLIDIGGESTRPGAREVRPEAERARTEPVVAELAAIQGMPPLSIDTRRAAIAELALRRGVKIVNDISALTFDPSMAGVVAASGAAVVLMHAPAPPAAMHVPPPYEDVLLDVHAALAARVAAAEAAGIPRARIAVDPGLGFGKTAAHNLALLRGLSLLHGLGVAVVVGASRKRFVGSASGEPVPERRLAGSLAVALAAAAQGAQVLRVHDVAETRQALAMWRAVQGGEA